MSIWTGKINFLAINPKLWMDKGKFCARSHFLVQAFSLFSYARHVCVDPERKVIILKIRKFWFYRKRFKIPFSGVAYIEYEMGSLGYDYYLPSSWSSALWGVMNMGTRRDQLESFDVALILKDKRRIPLFRFMGEGSCATGWGGVLLAGDAMLDLAGSQDSVSRQFAETLKKLLGVTIGEPLKHFADGEGHKRYCKKCKRPAPPKAEKCLYCGARVYSPEKKEEERTVIAHCVKCKRRSSPDRKKCMYCEGEVKLEEE